MRMLTVILALALTAPAHAELWQSGEAMMRGYSVWAGGFTETGPGELAAGSQMSPNVVGLRYYERQGIMSGMLMGILTAAAAGMAASQPKSVTRERQGNYIVTTTTYRSAAEQKAITDAGAASAAAMASANDQSFELNLYMQSLPGGGESSGYRMDMFFGAELSESIMLDFGLGFGDVNSRFKHDDGRTATVAYRYFGMPFRLNIAAGPLLLWTQWDWNWAGHVDERRDAETDARIVREVRPFPVKVGVAGNLFGRLYAEAVVTTPSYDSGLFATRFGAGMRF